jgi:hypothetical protein
MPDYGYRLSEQQKVYESDVNSDYLRSPGLMQGTEVVSTGTLTYMQFIAILKNLWETGTPNVPVLPVSVGKTDTLDKYPAIIGYAMELRKAHTSEPKPRFREHVKNQEYTVFGQRFQNIISFSIMSKVGTFQGNDYTITRDDVDTAVLCDELIERFEDFMQEYTPVFKAAGASELIYSRRLSDTEMNRESTDVHKRVVTYMVTTEKTFLIPNNLISEISFDIRNWVANVSIGDTLSGAYSNMPYTQIDFNQLSTPNS